jgi:hypothetical protein
MMRIDDLCRDGTAADSNAFFAIGASGYPWHGLVQSV